MQHRGSQREDAKRMVALLAPFQMSQNFGSTLGCRRLAPYSWKFLSCFKTIHDTYLFASRGQHPLRLLAKRLPRAERANFYLSLAPS